MDQVIKRIALFSIGCVLILSSCVKSKKENPSPANGSDRKEMLKHYADHIIIPGYTDFKKTIDSLTSKTNTFSANPTLSTLTDLRQAWLNAYIEWQKVELFDNDRYALRNFFNIYPTSVSGINANIASGTANLGLPAAYDKQGFPALDYLINGLGADDNAILVYYTTDADSAKRIAYLNKIITQMNLKLNNVYGAWTGSYRNEFISKTSMDIGSSTTLMVNGYVLNYERYIRSGKIGIPSGAMIGGTPSPGHVEAYYKKDISLTLAQTAHQASIDFFNGKSRLTGLEGPSLKTYLNSLDATDSFTGDSLTVVINDQFTEITSKLSLLNENLSQDVTSNNAAMVNTYTEMQAIIRMLKVDMTSAMSVTITYADTDGD